MKKDESHLIEILRSDVQPAPIDGAKMEHSLREAVRTFRNSAPDSENENPGHSWKSFGLGALSAAAIAIVAAAGAIGWWQNRPPDSADPNPVALTQLLTEIELLFPSQVTAVVLSDDEEIDIRLSKKSEPVPRPADQRVRLTFGREGKTVTALTYSGQRIELNLNGTVVLVTPLIQSDGTVFVMTEDALVFSSSPSLSRIAGFELTLARLLPENPDGRERS